MVNGDEWRSQYKIVALMGIDEGEEDDKISSEIFPGKFEFVVSSEQTKLPLYVVRAAVEHSHGPLLLPVDLREHGRPIGTSWLGGCP